MFTIEELLSKRNQREAFLHFQTKKDGAGADKMLLSELENYWKLNSDRIIEEIKNGSYQPGIVQNYEILNGKGKRRVISNLCVIDRFIARLLAQKLKRYIEPEFLPNSFAYQEGKGVLEAVQTALKYIQAGNQWVVEIDLQNYFDTIDLNHMCELLKEKISDSAINQLIYKYLYCKISQDLEVWEKKEGLVQGNPISPILSNLYLHEFDQSLEFKQFKWVRFADNICIFSSSISEAEQIFEETCLTLEKQYNVLINRKKSGIYDIFSRRLLGYEFYKTNDQIACRKYLYQKTNQYHTWKPCVVEKVNQEYHIIQNGVLNKKDYALLFENEDEKHHIPIGAIEQINIYSDITISSGVLKTFSENKLRMSLIDHQGNLLGYYIPVGYDKSAKMALKQCEIYLNVEERVKLAKKFEIAGIHNMRANIRYYHKKTKSDKLLEIEKNLTKYINEIRYSTEVDKMMLVEARARQEYYSAFNEILKQSDFLFTKRSKRPPQDELNAMISFGNTLLYNVVYQSIFKSSLDIRIGIIHAANHRYFSLNLDFADVWKPIIVDRVIFSLVNCLQIKSKEHFERKNDGVYLNKDGKRLFLEAFEKKLQDKLVVNGKKSTYRRLIENDVFGYQRYIMTRESYKPFKYY